MHMETERLLLRRWQPEDLEPYAAICSDPEVMRYIGLGQVRDREHSSAAIAAFEREWERLGFGLAAVVEKTSGQFIGFCGLYAGHCLCDSIPEIELGWRLGREWWGHGYATEAAKRMVSLAFDELGMASLISIIQTGNTASVKVAERLGMHEGESSIDPSCGRAVKVFRLSRP